MRKYWEMMKSQIKVDTAYPLWYWASSAATVVQMLIIFAFWNAVYENRTTISDMSLESMITYTMLAVLLNDFVAGVGSQLANQVRDGSVSIELMRPYNLLDKLVSLDLGFKISVVIRQTIPLLVIAYLFLGVSFPPSWEAALLFLLSAIIGIFIGTQLDLILGIAAFWLDYIWGLRMLRGAILLFFTGALVPITMFPEWLRILSAYLPFQSMVFIPVSIYTGHLTGMAAFQAILIQILWLTGIYVGIRLLWGYAIRRVTIFGG
ncbi:hypothetical protein D3C73_720770 [compost metagenome]